MTTADAARPARGRPRDASRDEAILDASATLLVEVGYEQLSIEAVAARAGVGKTTIYRRHPTKAHLVAAAVDRRGAWAPPPAAGATLREELLSTVGWMAHEIGAEQVGLLGALFAGMRQDPELAAAMRLLLHRDQAVLVEDLAVRPADRPTLTRAEAELVAEVATALVVHRVVLTGGPADHLFVEHVVDDVLLRLLHH